MGHFELPARPSLEYLRKLAKDRLRAMRGIDPRAKLSDAQFAIARDHGFPSWRALKAEVERSGTSSRDAFLAACAAGDRAGMQALLDRQPDLANARTDDGATPLHLALPHPPGVRLLLQRGADPDARDAGDNALPLHFAAAGAPIETVRLLIDAGSDVHGVGDAHALDVIGWAACFAEPRREVIDLLLAHGLFRTGEHYHALQLLVDVGADLEARDLEGRTPLAIAMLRGDRAAMRILHEAGAREPESQ
jgi:ankyrin repeat protein